MRRRDFPKALALTAAAGSLAAVSQAQAQIASPYPRGHFFNYLTETQRNAFLTNPNGAVLTAELQDWIDDCYGDTDSSGTSDTYRVGGYMPKGRAITTQTLQIKGSVILRGDGPESVIEASGCDLLHINGHRVTIEHFAFQGGHARAYAGLVVKGTTSAPLSALTARNLTMQGFLYAVNGEYLTESVIDNIEVQDSSYGVRLFGQCVNVSISNSRIILAGREVPAAPQGAACIVATVDTGAVAGRGEGLLVTNCLLASADSAFRSNGGFIAAGFYNCICDMLKGVGFDLDRVQAFTFNGPWVHAANACFKWPDPGSQTSIGASITVGRAETTAFDSVIYWGPNNKGLSVVGGQLKLMHGPGYPLSIHGSEVGVIGVNIVTAPNSGQYGAWVTGTNVLFAAVTGNATRV